MAATELVSVMETYQNDSFGTVRTFMIDEQPWLAGKDVAESLGYKNTKDAIQSHVDEEDRRVLLKSEVATLENQLFNDKFPVQVSSVEIPNRGLTVINESGIYSLIFSSKLPEAKKFKHWVTSEVIPSIRKKGYYVNKDMMTKQTTTDPNVPLTREELAMYFTHFINVGSDFIESVDKRLDAMEKSNASLRDGYDDLRSGYTDLHEGYNVLKQGYSFSNYRANKLEELVGTLITKLSEVHVTAPALPQNTIFKNSLSYAEKCKWVYDVGKSAEAIGIHCGKDKMDGLNEIYEHLRNSGVDIDTLHKEYTTTHPISNSIVNMLSDSDDLRVATEEAIQRLYLKYFPNQVCEETKRKFKYVDNKTEVKSVAKPEVSVKPVTISKVKKYKSQLIRETPDVVRCHIQNLADRNGWPYVRAANYIYREMEKRSHVNLKDLTRKYAQSFGYKECSKAYLISLDDTLLWILKAISEGK